MELTKEIKELYPFDSNFLDLDGNQMHYIDEGEGDVIICVHGNPTWSFYYRDVVKELSKTHRVIAFDHIGCGLSSKPQNYEYTLESRIKDMGTLVKYLGVDKYSLVVHDWGGAIGTGHAVRYPDSIAKMVFLNTAAFLSDSIPFSISLCKNKFFGDFLVKNLNGFCYPATFMTTEKKMSQEVKAGYLAPYHSVKTRVAISEFVKDIPLDPKHRSFKTLKNIEDNLEKLTCPKLILWGAKDFCFHDEFFVRFREIFPDAAYHYFKDAGHYVLEDERENVLCMMKGFF